LYKVIEFRHSTNTASFFSVLIAALIFSLSLAGVAAAQSNTNLGTGSLASNTTGANNTATGLNLLV
jgi:Tfp pilus assembly protein PilV